MSEYLRSSALVTGLLSFVVACSSAEQSNSEESTATSGGGDAYAAWQASLPLDPRGAYVVEGDIPVYNEDQLKEYYLESHPQNGALTVNLVDDKDDFWSFYDAYNLTYCISNNFGTKKADIIAAMSTATTTWQNAAEVKFTYVSAQDGDCTASNNNVVFDVRYANISGAARSFFPSYGRSERSLLVDDPAWTDSYFTLAEIITHELGHSLGARHEHIWTGCTSESTDNALRLTEHDTGSIMHYPSCPGATSNGSLTTRDKLGIACLYNSTLPRSACGPDRTGSDHMWVSQGAGRSFTSANFSVAGLYHPVTGDFDNDGATDIFLYGRHTGTDIIWWSDGDRTFTAQVEDVDGVYIPFVGDFDGQHGDDIFWYGPGDRADYIWWSNGDRTFTSQERNIGGRYRPLVGNFDGQHGDDIFFYGPGSGADVIFWSDGDRTFTVESSEVSGTYKPVAGDFDGDGRGDVFWYRPGTGADYVWYGTSDRTFTSRTYDVDGTYTAFVGNFDGQEGDDIFWYRAGSASDFIWWSDGDRTFTAGGNLDVDGNYVPLTGDFDDDGDDDIAWYGPLT